MSTWNPKAPAKLRKFWREQRRAYADRTRFILRNIKQNTPCKDCENSYPHYVMEFDHIQKPGSRNGKRWGVMGIVMSSRGMLLKELAKCEVVCANCHRIRTWKRSGCKEVNGIFKDWKRKHIASIIPRNGRFLVFCFHCRKKYWEIARKVKWEIEHQKLFCSIKCGFIAGDKCWQHRHKQQVIRFLRTKEGKKPAIQKIALRRWSLWNRSVK